MPCVNEESHSFTCQPHVYLNHTCLYYLVAELYHPLSGIHRPAEDRRLSRPRWPGGKLVTSTKYLLTYLHTHTLHRWAGTRKVKPIWISLKHETVSGSGISWAMCKSAPRSRQITTPAAHHSVFYRPDALPAAQPTASKH